MNVILTNGFLNKFRKDFRKYHFTISDLVKALTHTNLIKLNKPYNKVKIKLNGVDIRGIVLINFNNKILPIYLVLKKDKKYGENLLIGTEIENILKKLLKEIEEDLLNKNFIEY